MSQRDRLPQGWTISPIRDLCERVVVGFVGPSKQHYAFHGVPFLTGKNIKNGKLNLSKFDKVSHAFHEAQQKSQLQANDVVVIRIGRSGEAAVVPENLGPANCGGLVICKQPHRVLPRYLAHYLNSPHGQQASKAEVRGVTRSTLNTKSIERALVPVAPLPEQKRIADKLDRLLAAVDTCKARLDAIPDILKRFRRSVLAAAVSGELTEEWRAARCAQVCIAKQLRKEREQWWASASKRSYVPPESLDDELALLPQSWTWMRAEEVCALITKGTTPSRTEMGAQGEVPYIKVYNLTFRGILDFSIEPTFISAHINDGALARSRVFPGDVLMNIVGPPLGKVSLVPPTYPVWNINQAIAVFRPMPSLLSEYLALCLRDVQTLEQAQRKAKATAGQFNLTLEICRDIPLPIPPVEEQKEICRRVKVLLDTADYLEAKMHRSRNTVERIIGSVLSKAFNGELVRGSGRLQQVHEARSAAQTAADMPSARCCRQRDIECVPNRD